MINDVIGFNLGVPAINSISNSFIACRADDIFLLSNVAEKKDLLSCRRNLTFCHGQVA